MWDLGVVYDGNKVVSHRSFIKVLLNPLLRRFFGITIASNFSSNTNKFEGYLLVRQNEPKKWNFRCPKEMKHLRIEKIHMF